jgi:EmrB/QacA subfamily drug resistance transporter
VKTATNADASGGIDPRILKICFIMMIGSVAPALDSTIVNVAGQTMGTELGAPISAVQWVVTAYILAMGVTVPLAGWLDNRFSLKRIYIVSLAVFFAGSTLAGMSKSIVSLIVFRVIQGSGAGVLLPTLQSAIIHYAWKQKLALGRLMSIVGVPMLIVPILGPVIGGFIVNSLPWRWIFYVNIPVCAIGLLLALRLPVTEPVNRKQPIDIVGNLTLSAVFILIILGVSDIQNNGSASNMPVNPALPGLAFLAVYVAYALKTKGEPAINVRLYRYGSFSASSALYFTSAIVWMGTLFIMPLFFQQARNETSFNAGLLLAP